MANWTTADVVIFGVAGFLAATSLVRLMLQRRGELITKLEDQARRAKRRKSAENATTK